MSKMTTNQIYQKDCSKRISPKTIRVNAYYTKPGIINRHYQRECPKK